MEMESKALHRRLQVPEGNDDCGIKFVGWVVKLGKGARRTLAGLGTSLI